MILARLFSSTFDVLIASAGLRRFIDRLSPAEAGLRRPFWAIHNWIEMALLWTMDAACEQGEATLIVVLDISAAFVMDQFNIWVGNHRSCWFSLADTIQLQLWSTSRIGSWVDPFHCIYISNCGCCWHTPHENVNTTALCWWHTIHNRFDRQIKNVCKSSYFHICALHRIWLSLTERMANCVAYSLVQSCLDITSSLYIGMSSTNFDKLQRIQNMLARVVRLLKKRGHISAILKWLHWLPIHQHIDYRIYRCLCLYKILQSGEPEHLRTLLSDYVPNRNFRSAEKKRSRHTTNLSSHGITCFHCWGTPHLEFITTWCNKLQIHGYSIRDICLTWPTNTRHSVFRTYDSLFAHWHIGVL